MKKARTVLALLLAAAPFALAACFGAGPEATVKRFYRHVEEGELDQAAELMSNAVLAQVSLDKLKQGLQSSTLEIDEKGGIERIETVHSKVIGEVAEVTVRIHYGNGEDETEELELVQEDGRWKLNPSGGK